MPNRVFEKLRRFRYSGVKFARISQENWLFERFRKFKLEREPRLVWISLENELYARFMSLREANESNEFGITPKNYLNYKCRQLN